jgi:predicted 2-oxoglutarate/Fe(II)-dependent dioxygenase YbiX
MAAVSSSENSDIDYLVQITFTVRSDVGIVFAAKIPLNTYTMQTPTKPKKGNDFDDAAMKVLVQKWTSKPFKTELKANPITIRQMYSTVPAFTIDNVLSAAECKEFIAISETHGYKPALVNVGGGRQKLMPEIRSHDRAIIDSKSMVTLLFDRIKHLLPQTNGKKGCMHLSGLNERLRVLRYDPPQYFKPHYDGSYSRNDGSNERSLYTVMLYLNGNFEGGETTFFEEGFGLNQVKCTPKAGMVLVFEHRVLHEGALLTEGRKYAVRTDVMYQYRKTKIVTA